MRQEDKEDESAMPAIKCSHTIDVPRGKEGQTKGETLQLQQEGMGVRLEEGLSWASEIRCNISNPLPEVSPDSELSESSAIQPRDKGCGRPHLGDLILGILQAG